MMFFLWSYWGFLSGQATEDGVNNWVRKISPALFHIYVANRRLLCTIFYNDWPDVVLNLIMLLANQETRETHDDEQGDFFYKNGLVIVSFFMSTTVSYILFLSNGKCMAPFEWASMYHHLPATTPYPPWIRPRGPTTTSTNIILFLKNIHSLFWEIQKKKLINLTFPIFMLFFLGQIFSV